MPMKNFDAADAPLRAIPNHLDPHARAMALILIEYGRTMKMTLADVAMIITAIGQSMGAFDAEFNTNRDAIKSN